MSSEDVITRNGPVTGAEVEDLRAAVEWDRMEGRYDKILKGLYCHYCARQDGELVGFLSVISDGAADALLVDIMVRPKAQGKSLGKQLVRKAVADLTGEGIRAIQVIFNPALRDFYRGLGFHILYAGIIDNEVEDHCCHPA